MSTDVQAAIARLWRESRPLVLKRAGALEQTAAALAAGPVPPARVEAARVSAHKLAGSLGSFGLAAGSELAAAIERELQDGAPDPSRLSQLAAQLCAAVRAFD